MDCPTCGKQISVLDRVCPHCGASSTPLLHGKPLDWRADEAGAAGGHRTGWNLAGLPRPQGPAFLNPDHVTLEPDASEIQQIGQFVFYSPHIQNNPMYRERLGGCNLLYMAEMDEVNAFATDRQLPGVDLTPPFIVMLAGMARAARLVALALGAHRHWKSQQSRAALAKTVHAIGRHTVQDHGDFTADAFESAARAAGLLPLVSESEAIRMGRSYAAAVNMNIIGHEAGHIALGHTLARAANHEVNRNQEREADSFAASLISTSPFSDYLVGGSIFFWVILAWVDAAAGGGQATTHPHSRERLMDFIRANRDQADAIGLSEAQVAAFLPADDLLNQKLIHRLCR